MTATTTAAAAGLVLAFGWAHILHRAGTEQSPAAAWGLVVIALAATAGLHRARRTWATRALLWAALLGLVLERFALLAALALLTGAQP